MKLDQSWQRYYSGKHPDLVTRYDVMVDLVKPLSVLDVGCGQGLLGFLLCTRRPEVTRVVGVDLSEVMLADGRRRYGISQVGSREVKVRLEHADACALPFDDESFSSVVLCEVLEHLEDPTKAVGEALRVLAPEGRVITSVPAGGVRSKAHLRVFTGMKQLLVLYGDDVEWKRTLRLYGWYFAWGDKR